MSDLLLNSVIYVWFVPTLLILRNFRDREVRLQNIKFNGTYALPFRAMFVSFWCRQQDVG